jgi:hypothetical protein
MRESERRLSMNRNESFSFYSSSRSIEKIKDDDEDEQMSVGSWSQCAIFLGSSKLSMHHRLRQVLECASRLALSMAAHPE